jgi:ankyrin repeat protein
MLGETPLTAAVLCPATNAFIFLLNSGANIDARNRGGETPLMVACVLGDQGWQKVSLLVKAGADVNAKDTNGFSVLQHAQGAGATQIVQFLIKSGAKTN